MSSDRLMEPASLPSSVVIFSSIYAPSFSAGAAAAGASVGLASDFGAAASLTRNLPGFGVSLCGFFFTASRT